MSCVVCGSSDLRELRPAEVHRLEDVSFSYSFSPAHCRTFRVVACGACTHAFCAPLPAGLADRYEDVVDEEYLQHAESRRLAADAVLADVQALAPGGLLLDVGCATGDFLLSARARGYRVEGLELSTWSRELARGRGLVVHASTLEALARARPGAYDVVSLIGVIEHFTDPVAELEHIAALLRPGGVLVMWTGDSASLLARALGRRWWYWQGQHIQYFTHASLKLAVQRAGFAHARTARYPFRMTGKTLTNSLRRYPMHRLLSAVLAPLFERFPIYLRLPGELLFFATRR